MIEDYLLLHTVSRQGVQLVPETTSVSAAVCMQLCLPSCPSPATYEQQMHAYI